MRKDFQEVKQDSLIDEIVNLIDYAEGEIETDEDGLGRQYADVNVNWADEETVRIILRTLLWRYDVHFKGDLKTEAIAEKIFEIVGGEDRKNLMCFAFGLFMSRMRRSDVRLMVGYAKKVRDWKRGIEDEEKEEK